MDADVYDGWRVGRVQVQRLGGGVQEALTAADARQAC